MSSTARPTTRTTGAALALLGSAAALAAGAAPASAHPFPFPLPPGGGNGGLAQGQVFTETNDPAGNRVLAFARTRDGHLVQSASVPTGGTGTGAGLGSQGPVIAEGGAVYAVDAGSGGVAVLRGGHGGLKVIDHEAAGTTPVSITVHGSLAYVLDAGGTGQVLGYRVGRSGELHPLPGATAPLSDGAAGAAEVAFSPDGHRLVVTEKGTNRIDTYRVGFGGRLYGPVVNASTGATPFGFAFDPAGRLIVSEAGASTASSYALRWTGTLATITASVPTLQGAACWVAITPNGRYAYTGNGGGTITGFSVGVRGTLTKLRADGVSAVSPRANEVAITDVGRTLLNVNPGSGSITPFAIGRDGALTPLPVTTGLPVGLAGIAIS